MADHLLSDEERRALLALPATRTAAAGCLDSEPSPAAQPIATELPRPLCPDVERALRAIGRRWAERSEVQLTSLLRQSVRVELAVRGMSSKQVAAQIAPASWRCPVLAPPLAGSFTLQIDGAVLHPAIDCMLGGTAAQAPPRSVERPFSEIDLRLVRRIARSLVLQLRAAFRPVLELDLAIDAAAGSSDRPVLLTGETVARLACQITIGAARGTASILIPSAALAALRETLSADKEKGQAAPPGQGETDCGPHADRTVVELIACLAETRITDEELRHLEPGDLIKTDQAVDEPITVLADGVQRFRAHSGAKDGHKAVEIHEVGQGCEPHSGSLRQAAD